MALFNFGAKREKLMATVSKQQVITHVNWTCKKDKSVPPSHLHGDIDKLFSLTLMYL